MKPAAAHRRCPSRLDKRRARCAFLTWVALLIVVANCVVSVTQAEPVRVVPIGVPAAFHQDIDPDEDSDEEYIDGAEDDVVRPINITADEKGTYVGAPCEFTCSPKLLHVFCNPVSGTCECDKKHPVKLNNPYAGCSKPTRLGDQCYYMETCKYTDQHASCIQVHHHAVCQCENGFHSVSIDKPTKKIFCAEDVAVMTSNFSTFAGVLSGIAILTGLICFVLHLFNQNLYETRHHRHRFGNANLAPPILFSSDPGSRRPSIASVHSSTSVRSYSARRYERERREKEERELERRFKLAASSAGSVSGVGVGMGVQPSPSPHSVDDLLPTLEEDRQVRVEETDLSTRTGILNTAYSRTGSPLSN